MSKSITVRYFAVFREHAGLDEETVTLDVDTTSDVFDQTRHRHGSSEPLGHCKVAINDEMADWNSAVSDGDTVLLFPPVAGG
ncbi:MAG: MoaD/ThiS family protein [Woeseiaceae bacterium]